jgi:multiple antibiotic resistance protein
MNEFWLCFIPLFVAVDAIGVLPIFIGITANMPPQTVEKILIQSLITATVVALLFLTIGAAIFKFLGITTGDFMVAGGILLLFISLSDLISMEKIQRQIDPDSFGAVPIGVPLITGPAVLTTIVLLNNQYGPWLTSLAIIINILIAGGVFYCSKRIVEYLGKAGVKILSKIASLFLTAMAVMMIRKDIVYFIQASHSQSLPAMPGISLALLQ